MACIVYPDKCHPVFMFFVFTPGWAHEMTMMQRFDVASLKLPRVRALPTANQEGVLRAHSVHSKHILWASMVMKHLSLRKSLRIQCETVNFDSIS